MIFDSLSNLSLTFSLEREETPMKKILSTTVIAITIFTCSIAAAKTITIEWDMSDTSNVTGYKMYYSYSNNMDNKILACETNNPDITSLSCSNITFTSPISYWTIGAVTSTGELESIPKSYDATLMKVQNFAVLTPGANSPPTAIISSDPTSGTAPATIFFDGTESSDPDGTIVSYAWNFGDGSTGSSSFVNHTYASPGSYNVLLSVTDDRGDTDNDQLTITVNEPSFTDLTDTTTYWACDNFTLDKSGGEETVTTTNAVITQDDGYFGAGLDCTGNNMYATIPSAGNINMANGSIEMMVKLTQDQTDYSVSYFVDGQGTGSFSVVLTSSKIMFRYGGLYLSAISEEDYSSLVAGTWYKLKFSWSPTNASINLDDLEIKSSSHGESAPDITTIRFSGTWSASIFAILDEIKIQ